MCARLMTWYGASLSCMHHLPKPGPCVQPLWCAYLMCPMAGRLALLAGEWWAGHVNGPGGVPQAWWKEIDLWLISSHPSSR